MTLLQKIFNTSFIKTKFTRVVKYSIASSNDVNTIYFKSNFTEEEQTKILSTLNNSNPSHLSRLHLPQNKIKNIQSWKNKKGPFRSLNEVLEVDGLGEKLLHKICEDIVNENWDKSSTTNTDIGISNVKNKRQKQIVTPPINGSILNNITCAVGVHLSPIGISWAKLSKDNNQLVNWNFESFSHLPKKMMPNDSFHTAINIIKKIPPSDVYVFESSPSSGLTNQNTQAASSYTQHIELNAMLFALLNTSVDHNVTLQNHDNTNTTLPKSIENRVFYLRFRLSARLFSTLVGQEKVAAATTIDELLNSDTGTSQFSLPCTPVMVEQQLKNAFNAQSSANKELLGQALMLVITFMDLCVYRNPVSLDVVFAAHGRNKKLLIK